MDQELNTEPLNLMFTKKSRFEYKFLVLRLHIINIEIIRKTEKTF